MNKRLHPIKHDLKTALWCGPAALATITGHPTSYIMKLLRHITRRNVVKGLYNIELTKALDFLGYRYFEQPGGGKTLARWTEDNKHLLQFGPLIVNIPGHYVTVSGRSFNDNSTRRPVALKKAPHRRCRVEKAYQIAPPKPDFVPAAIPEPVEPLKPAAPNYRAKARALAKKHGVEITVGDPSPDTIGVWPPPSLDHDEKDPHEGDHYVYDWAEALGRVNDYAEALNRGLQNRIENPALAGEGA